MLLRNVFLICVYVSFKIVYTSCKDVKTLAFAIDNSGSMDDDLENVKNVTKAITKIVFNDKKNTFVKTVIVTINDPDVKIRASNRSPQSIEKVLNDLRILYEGKKGCEEKSLTGMEKALLVSGLNSQLFVFTDSNAIDYEKAATVIRLCREKKSPVVIIYSIDERCSSLKGKSFFVYYEIAKACSGQMYIVEKNEYDSVLNPLKILLQDKIPISKWSEVKNDNKLNNAEYKAVPFELDDTDKYAMIYASGDNISLRVTTVNDPKGAEYASEKILWNKNGKFVKMLNTKPGNYYAWVKGRGDVNVVVYGRSIQTEALKIHNTKNIYYGIEGDLVMKIPCNATGIPAPTVTWSIQNNPDRKPTVEGSTLIINKPVKSDTAVYVCQARNKLANVSKKFQVMIVDSFEDDDNFKGAIHQIYVEEGKSKTINCSLPHVTKDSIRWYEDGLLSEHVGTTYTIENASLDDQKNYTCRVNTEEGSISETYVLTIGDIPMFDHDRSTTIDWRHNPMELDCKAYGHPDPQFTWEHNGNVLKTEYTVQEMNVMDWGEYKCHVSNEIGKISRTFKVITSGCYVTKYVGSQNQPLISSIDAPTQPTSIKNNGVFIETNAEVKFSCPNTKHSSNNFKMLPEKREIIAKCISEDRFNVNGNTYKYSDLKCKTKVVPSVIRTEEKCYDANSKIIRVGFEVNGFLEAYKVCYDTKLNVPLYGISANELVPEDLKYTVDLADHTWNFTPELGNAKTGNLKTERNCTCCYKQGQLINANILAFGPVQDATFTYNLNAVPIWTTLCDNSRVSWEKIEESVKILSAMGFETWHSWTGASEYNNKDGGLVPRYLWKVVNRNDKFSVVVFVNDGSPVNADIRCSTTCDFIEKNDDKFLYCCSLEQFNERFGVPLTTFKLV